MSWTISLSFILVIMTQHFCNHLETATAKYPPSGECAWITFHFLSFVGMVLCVYRDSFVGGMLRGLAQVALMLVVPLSSQNSLLPDPWRSVSNSLLNLSSSWWSWISFTKKLSFSGYNNVRCVHWICDWWNRNFYSISVKNFSQYDLS